MTGHTEVWPRSEDICDVFIWDGRGVSTEVKEARLSII